MVIEEKLLSISVVPYLSVASTCPELPGLGLWLFSVRVFTHDATDLKALPGISGNCSASLVFQVGRQVSVENGVGGGGGILIFLYCKALDGWVPILLHPPQLHTDS